MAKMRKTKSSVTKTVKKTVDEEPVVDDVDDVEEFEETQPEVSVRKVVPPRMEPRAKVKLKNAAKLVYLGETYLKDREYNIVGDEMIEKFRKHGRFLVIDL